MIKKIKENIYKISHDSNIYLYLEPFCFLIDCGNSNDKEKIKKEIDSIISKDKIKLILLTHMHYDHCGNCDLFEDAQIYASKEDLKNFNENPNYFFVDNFSEKEIQRLKKAEVLSEKILDLDVLKTPGHTNGSVCFIDKKNKLIFSGDNLFYNGIGRTDFINSKPEKMDETLNKIKKIIKKEDLELMSCHDY